MKRFYLFFASVILIMASDIFVGCKMNGGGNGNNQSGQNTPDATYGFVPATEYTLVYEDGDTGKPYAGQKFKGSVLIAIAKELGLSTDSYTIDEANKKVTILTGKQLYDYLVNPSAEVAEKLTEIINGENNNGTGDNGGSTGTELGDPHKVMHGSDTGSYSLALIGENQFYKTGETVKFNIVKNPNSDAVGYIVAKVENTNTKEAIKFSVVNNQISFTMPDKDVSVSAEFIDVVTYESGDYNCYFEMKSFVPFKLIYMFVSEEEATNNNFGGKCVKKTFDFGNGPVDKWIYELTDWINDKSTIGEPGVYDYYFLYINELAKGVDGYTYLWVMTKNNELVVVWNKK